MRLPEDLLGIVLAAVGNCRILMPLNRSKAADPGDDAGELCRHLPGGVEGADAAGGEAGDGAGVGVGAEVVVFGDLGEELFREEARVAVGDGVVFGGPHGVLGRALPLCGIGGYEAGGGASPGSRRFRRDR